MKVMIEYTDTFGGYANYAWAHRAEIEMPEDAKDAEIKRAAKREMRLSGVRGKWTSFGDSLEFRPFGYCTVLFVNFEY